MNKVCFLFFLVPETLVQGSPVFATPSRDDLKNSSQTLKVLLQKDNGASLRCHSLPQCSVKPLWRVAHPFLLKYNRTWRVLHQKWKRVSLLLGFSVICCLNLLKNTLFICLWGYTGSQLWHVGSSIFDVALGIFSCGKRTLSCGLGPGIKPLSPALAGGFLTTGPPGKSSIFIGSLTC